MQFSSIWLRFRILSGATTSGQGEPGSDGNEGIPCILQSSCITKSSPSDCFVSYPGRSLRESYPSAEMQVVYSATPADWAIDIYRKCSLEILSVHWQKRKKKKEKRKKNFKINEALKTEKDE